MLRLFLSLYLFLIVLYFVVLGAIEEVFIPYYQPEITQDLAKTYRSAVLLLEELQPRLSQNEWRNLLARVSDQSNIPMKSATLAQWNLKEIDTHLQNPGDIYVEDFEEDLLYVRLNQNIVVRIGPMQTMELFERISLYLLLFVLFLCGFAVLTWAGWQQYKIKCLSKETQQFSEGKLDARAPMGILSIPHLSKAFNMMAERIERLFLSHKQLTNAVSHELRSPVARARFQLELLDREQSKSKQDPYLKGLSENLDEMDFLIDEILSYAKMERSEQLPKLEETELTQWLVEQGNILAQEISLAITLDLPEVKIQTRFDPILVARLLRNLVANADCYAQKTITIGAQQDNGIILLWVDDDGSGIPENQRDNLFEPFFRLDQSRNRNTGVYGLGLAIAAQIARCHNGSIQIDNSPLGGARFIFSWESEKAS